MTSLLFRQEALNFKRQRHLGEVMLVRPLSFALLTAIAISIAVAIIGFAFWGEYTRKVHVQGYLAPSMGLIKVYPPEAGTLIEKHVTEGQLVKRGDRLFVLSTERSSPLTPEAQVAAIAQLRQRRDKISTKEQELTEYESRRNIVITAPSDGVVSTILATDGQNANTASPLLSILPAGAVLEAQLLVPSRAIGFIALDQTVALRYQPFPYQRFGSHRGRIKEISRTLITPNDADLPVTLQESVYRVTVALDAQRVKAYGQNLPLQAGTLLDADIWLDHRRIIEWVIDPLFSVLGRV